MADTQPAQVDRQRAGLQTRNPDRASYREGLEAEIAGYEARGEGLPESDPERQRLEQRAKDAKAQLAKVSKTTTRQRQGETR